MSTITFISGPFDGHVHQVLDRDVGIFEFGIVKRSEGDHKPRYAVYLPNGRGDVEFHAYAPSLNAGLAMLPKENRR